MSRYTFVLLVAVAGCKGPDAPVAGAADLGMEGPDLAPIKDAAIVTYVRDVQPLLQGHCSACHSAADGASAGGYLFADAYAETQRASTLCPGDRVGTCIGLAVENQAPEGNGCRTYVVRPFHRPSWKCLSDPERALIAAWVAGGLIER